MRYSVILLIFLVMVALALSGCSGSNTSATPTPTPSGGYTTGTPTPTPGASGLTSASQLFNMKNLHMYEYKLTSVASGQTTVATYKIEYSDSTYQGTPAKLTQMTYNMPGDQSVQMLVSLYYDKGDDHLLGGNYKMTAGGQTMEFPISADQGSTYTQNDWASSTESSIGDVSLANAGSETITVNGKPYACSKYTWTSGGTSYTVWYTAQAPMPLKYEWSDNQSNSWKMELTDWS